MENKGRRKEIKGRNYPEEESEMWKDNKEGFDRERRAVNLEIC